MRTARTAPVRGGFHTDFIEWNILRGNDLSVVMRGGALGSKAVPSSGALCVGMISVFGSF